MIFTPFSLLISLHNSNFYLSYPIFPLLLYFYLSYPTSLQAAKDTVAILQALQECFPFPLDSTQVSTYVTINTINYDWLTITEDLYYLLTVSLMNYCKFTIALSHLLTCYISLSLSHTHTHTISFSHTQSLFFSLSPTESVAQIFC